MKFKEYIVACEEHRKRRVVHWSDYLAGYAVEFGVKTFHGWLVTMW